MGMTNDARWAAVLRRDGASDGSFYFSVSTTGVYCRPSCPARHARREHVRFHATAAAAEQQGFRPCRRCRPNGPSLAQRRAEAVARACRLVTSADDLSIVTVDRLAAAAGFSRHHFQRVFKTATGVTPKAWVAAERAQRVQKALPRASRVTDAIYDAGFGSAGRFYAGAPKTLGMKPSAARAGGRDTSIRFAVGACSLGAILVAASRKGLCAILLGDDPTPLVRDLQDRFPRAQLRPGDAGFERWVATVVGFVDAPRVGLDLPLDIRGTAFQQRVWRALSHIRVGATATYTDVAKAIGLPRAARAVAAACAANPLAVAIPCHRVVKSDGAISGYRWGVERKRILIGREKETESTEAAAHEGLRESPRRSVRVSFVAALEPSVNNRKHTTQAAGLLRERPLLARAPRH